MLHFGWGIVGLANGLRWDWTDYWVKWTDYVGDWTDYTANKTD